MHVLFFTRILRIKQEQIALREQRQSERYAVGAGFPLSVTLAMPNHEIRGRVANLSVTGIGLKPVQGRASDRGQGCRCLLEIEAQRLEIPAEIAHAHEIDGKVQFGAALRIDDFATKAAYLQLMETIAMAATLAPHKLQKAVEDAPWLRGEQYRGEGKSNLTVWREVESRAIDSFEFQLDDYFVRGHAKSPNLEVYTQESRKDLHKSGYSDPALKQLAGENEEVRRLFRWAVPNLSTNVPDDVCAFLARHAPPSDTAAVSQSHRSRS